MAQRAAFRIGYREPVELFTSEGIAEAVESTIRRLAGVLGEQIESEVQRITEEAEKVWPIGEPKGNKRARNKRQPYHSAYSFLYGLRVRGSYLEGYIDNYAINIRGKRYWFFIKTNQRGLRLQTTVKKSKIVQPARNEPGSPINAYIKRPLKEAATRMAVEMADEIREMIREGGGG